MVSSKTSELVPGNPFDDDAGAIWDEEDVTFDVPPGKPGTRDLGLLGNVLFVAHGGRITKITNDR